MALTKEDIAAISDLLKPLRDGMEEVKGDLREVEDGLQTIKRKVTGVEMHLENGTDKNIQLIAENFIELTNKLNQAIPAADKNLAYEVKVNYLVEKVQTLEKEIAQLKSKIA